MNRLLSAMLCALALFAQAAPAAETVSFSFAGCVDSRERPVASRPDADLPVLLETRLIEGNRVIFYNPSLLPQLLPETRAFLYAHECARTRLGLSIDLARSLADAERADCWAANTLLRSKLIKNAAGLTAIETDLSLASEEDWAKLPGPARELHLAACVGGKPATRGAQGNVLDVNVAPASPAWNACVLACGNRLFACGRGASCQASFDQCKAACTGK